MIHEEIEKCAGVGGSNWKKGKKRDEIIHVLNETGNERAMYNSDYSLNLLKEEIKEAHKSWKKKSRYINKL